MNKNSRLTLIAGVVAAIVLMGIAIGWFAGRGPETPPVSSATQSHDAPDGDSGSPGASAGSRSSTPTPPRPPRSVPVTAVPNSQVLLTNWEDKVDAIISKDGEDADKVLQLLGLFPSLPAEGQEEAAQHMANLASDAEYGTISGLTTNAALSEAVLDVLLADLLNRPNAAKMPALLEIARNPLHSKAEEARDLLELFLEEDYGADWGKWQAALDKWMRENPD